MKFAQDKQAEGRTFVIFETTGELKHSWQIFRGWSGRAAVITGMAEEYSQRQRYTTGMEGAEVTDHGYVLPSISSRSVSDGRLLDGANRMLKNAIAENPVHRLYAAERIEMLEAASAIHRHFEERDLPVGGVALVGANSTES